MKTNHKAFFGFNSLHRGQFLSFPSSVILQLMKLFHNLSTELQNQVSIVSMDKKKNIQNWPSTRHLVLGGAVTLKTLSFH